MYPVKRPRRRIWLWILWILVFTVLLATAAGVFLFKINKFVLEIQPAGDPNIVLDYGEKFLDAGASVKLMGSLICTKGLDIDAEIETSGNVNTDIAGKYRIVYTSRFLFWQASAERTVDVVDRKPPRITLVINPDAYTIPGQEYVEEGFSAFDEYDGDITHLVERQEKDGAVIYSVMDSSGNLARETRTIRYYDPIPPVITLQGEQILYIDAGAEYVEPGYTAEDNCDGVLTDQVTTEGEVDQYHAGTYTLRYCVSDSYGNTASVTRTVVVKTKPQPSTITPGGKVIYLTFDDGPGRYTEQLLSILDMYNVKATFFVVNSRTDIMKKIVDSGHSIGIHSATHNYREIYASEEAFFADLYKMQDIIFNATGVKTTLMRFPGGSSNTVSSFNKGIMTRLTNAVCDLGFQYFDWNVDSMDAGGAKKSDQVADNVISGVKGKKISLVLQHDIHGFSVDAVEEIITWGLANGYTFLPLDTTSPPCHHGVNN